MCSPAGGVEGGRVGTVTRGVRALRCLRMAAAGRWSVCSAVLVGSVCSAVLVSVWSTVGCVCSTALEGVCSTAVLSVCTVKASVCWVTGSAMGVGCVCWAVLRSV